MTPEAEAMGKQLLDAVRSHVARAVAKVEERCEVLEGRVQKLQGTVNKLLQQSSATAKHLAAIERKFGALLNNKVPQLQDSRAADLRGDLVRRDESQRL